jgi:hypothetical protein
MPLRIVIPPSQEIHFTPMNVIWIVGLPVIMNQHPFM